MHTKYGRIATELREAILRGDYPPGSTLPPIPELVRRYDVARDTVRDAISALTNEGLVTPLRGIGTVVRDITPVALAYRPEAPAQTWTQQNSADPSATDTVVSSDWEAADQDIAGRLQLTVGVTVLHRIRHQSKGAGVAQIHDQWIPERIVQAITREASTDLSDLNDIPQTDLFSLMRTAGYNPTETTELISARMPDPVERDIMNLPPGVPVLITRRITRLSDTTPVETSTFAGASDRMTQSFTLPLHTT